MSASAAAIAVAARERCAGCVHWTDDRALFEASIPGLTSFGSAYGASVGTTGLCLRNDRLVRPHDGCAAFVSRGTAGAGDA